MSVTNPIEILEACYAITAGDVLLPGAAGYPVGAVATVFTTEKGAGRFLQSHAEMIAVLGLGKADFKPVGDPWIFMRMAAAEGLAGIELGDEGTFNRFMFMVRVEEAGRTLPTVLTSMTAAGWGPSLTRVGVREFDHAELLHWSRYDILDQVSGLWGMRCPFRGWDHGEVLYELSAPGRLILVGDVPLFGDWNSTEGAVPFFTSEEMAGNFLQHHLGLSSVAEMRFPVEGPSGSSEAEDIRLAPVHDLSARLEELSELAPFAAWCINPSAHREDAAIGRLWDTQIEGDDWSMQAVSGIWRIMSRNHFELVERLAPWSGKDTIRWSGGTTLQLHPLDRSFVAQSRLKEDLSDTEIDELVEARLNAEGIEPLLEGMLALGDLEDRRRLNLFHLVSWDSVTGDGADFPFRFDDFISALRYLAAFERYHDRTHRAEGAVSCQHIGFKGSGDREAEALRSVRFQLGIKRLGIRVLKQGYRPADADDLVSLCNGNLRTLHVEYAGFPVDLLWASPEESSANVGAEVEEDDKGVPAGQCGRLLEQLAINPEIWASCSKELETPIDPAGERIALDRMSREQWDALESRSRHFVSTGLLHLDLQGHAPMLDYAPISIEIVKALEVELGAIFTAFSKSVDEPWPEHNNSHGELTLYEFLNGGKAPTLGAMSYLLRVPREGASPLLLKFHEFVSGLSNAEDITRNKFLKRGLPRVLNKYRNGGAHDSPISEEVCRECVDVLIGAPDKPGYIPVVSRWKQ